MQGNPSALLPYIVALPLLGGIINGLFGKRFSKQLVYAISNTAGLGSFLIAVMAFFSLREATHAEIAEVCGGGGHLKSHCVGGGAPHRPLKIQGGERQARLLRRGYWSASRGRSPSDGRSTSRGCRTRRTDHEEAQLRCPRSHRGR